MRLKFLFTLTLVLAATTGGVAHAEGTSGLVDGIWFSQDPVTNFEEVTVHSVIHNQTEELLQGIATLVVDGDAVGAQEVRIGAGDIQKVSIEHKFSSGTHTVGMSFTAGNGVDVTLTELQAQNLFVVVDTDGDGIQDTTDPDDDNDGIPDEEDAEPLVKNIIPKPKVDLSEAGQGLLKKITGRFEGDEDEEGTEGSESTEGEVATEEASTNTIVTVIRNIEDARKRGAEAMREREEIRREALEEIARAEEELPAVEGFEPSTASESKKREHQIAAAGASVTGTVLEHGWLFYLHIFILVLSVIHISWGWFRKRFANIDTGDDE